MEKTKYNEIPMEYRRNYKKELKEFCGLTLTALLFVAFLAWMFWMA